MTYAVYPVDNPQGQIFLPAGDLNGDGSTNADPRVGMLTGIAGVVRVRDGAALTFGAAGALIAQSGFIRTPNAVEIVVSRNALNLDDIAVLSIAASNAVYIGFNVAGLKQASAVLINGGTSIGFYTNSTARLTINANGLTLPTNHSMIMGIISATLSNKVYWGTTASAWDGEGSGSPEGVHTAPVGSTFRRRDGGAGTTLYVKESGVGNVGWVGK